MTYTKAFYGLASSSCASSKLYISNDFHFSKVHKYKEETCEFLYFKCPELCNSLCINWLGTVAKACFYLILYYESFLSFIFNSDSLISSIIVNFHISNVN